MVSNRTMWMIGGTILSIWAVGTFYLNASPNGAPDPAQAQRSTQKAEYPVKELMKPGPLPEIAIGAKDAPITVVEYSSLTCPHCASFHSDSLPKLKEKYIDTGKVRYIIREFPLDNLAAAAFMLARCAGPEKNLPMIELLYAKQKDWAFVKDSPLPPLRKLLKINAGIDEDAFNKCLSDQKTLDKVLEIRKRGDKVFGVSSTPTFFVNGKVLKGGHSLEEFEKIMADDLKKIEESKKK